MSDSSNKTGVLLVNLGTPSAPTPKAIKYFLSQFLGDRRVVDLPSLLWSPILHGIVLPRRAKQLVARYQSIWTDNGSPLLATSQQLCVQLQQRLPQYKIALGMTYGQPSISSALLELASVKHLIVLPLFPQYSSSTTAAVWDAIARHYKRRRDLPALTFIRDYATHPLYIDALCESVERTSLKEEALLLFSYHSVPMRYLNLGDDYATRCALTTERVTSQLGITHYRTSYQSRFGRTSWLSPYTNAVLKALPEEGITKVKVITPGFSIDCLETLDEIDNQDRACFLNAGGQAFEYIPALNARSSHVELLTQLIIDNDNNTR